MICQKCGLKNATVHITKIYNNQKTELNLCNECAEKFNKESNNFDFNFNFNLDSFGLDNLITSFFGINQIPNRKEIESIAYEKECDYCHTTLMDLRNTGRVGCANCYNVFKDELIPIIKKVHGTTHHTGHSPKGQSDSKVFEKIRHRPEEEEIKKLKEEMRIAIAEENYERAAVIRDKIKDLESKINDDNSNMNGGKSV